MRSSRTHLSYRQSGVATLLIVVLLGFSLTATILAGLNQTRSSQEFGISLHSQTVAQQRVWSAAEALRQYLQQVANDPESWATLYDKLNAAEDAYPAISIDGYEGLNATFTGVDFDTGTPERVLIMANISARAAPDTHAASTSSLQLVFEITPPTSGSAPSDKPSSPNALYFFDDLNISGDIEFLVGKDQVYDIFVDGNVKAGGVSLKGMDTIRSTQSIEFQGGSSSDFRELHASCDVKLASGGGFHIESIRATNNVCLENAASSSLIEANGSVALKGNSHQSVWSSANSNNLASCAADAKMLCKVSQDGVTIDWSTPVVQVHTKGMINAKSATSANRWRAEKQIIINGCPDPADIISGENVSVASWCNTTFRVQPGLQLAIPMVDPVQVQEKVFDANSLRGSAHFLYYRHAGKTRVKVKGITGMPDSEDPINPQEIRDNGYFQRAALLPEGGWQRKIANHACITPIATGADRDNCWKLATAFNDGTELPKFDGSGWKLDGKSHAPGIVFLDGNVEISNGYYTNTFIATGNAKLSSSGNTVAAPNYVGAHSRGINSSPFQGVCHNDYGLAPKAFCADGDFDYSALSGLGNFALLAGSCPLGSPGKCSTSQYIGGNIQIAGTILGAVTAGNTVKTAGNTRVTGYVSALALAGRNSQGENKFGNSTKIDLTNLPTGYDPTGGATDDNDGDIGSGDGGNGESAVTPGNVKLKWSRYR